MAKDRIIDKTLTEEEVHLLKHMLGADSRYVKSKWGWRNYFYLSSQFGLVYETLISLKDKGLLRSSSPVFNKDGIYFYATVQGCKSIGLHKAAINRAIKEN